MNENIIVAVDAMGGDNAPKETVSGAVLALSNPKLQIVLLGNEDKISQELSKHDYDKSRIEIVNTTQVIETGEAPTVAIKQKKDSSMVVGFKLLKDKKAHAFVSAGNTGALLAGATIIVGRIKGIERPALATLIPNSKGFTFLVDSGANIDCKASYLAQFGLMGSVYMEYVMGVKNPRVGLVNIGTEKEKGNALTKEAYELLEKEDINFIGNCEARDIPFGAVDVAVCDAFVGNVILKYTEGLSKFIFDMVKTELMSTTMSKIGALFSKGAYDNLKKRYDFADIGGAPFLGLNALVVKAHGNSDARAFRGAINQCIVFIENDLIAKIQQKNIIEGVDNNGI